MKNIHIPVILGTARVGNVSHKIAKAVQTVIEQMEGYSTQLVDVRDHVSAAVTVPPWGEGGADEQPTAWKEIVEQSHGLVFVIPEYNHTMPGELKLLLDSLTSSYTGKAVGLVGVSAGTLGAARMMDHVRPVFNTLNMHIVKDGVHISEASTSVTDAQVFVDSKTHETTRKMVSEVAALSSALATMK